MSLCVQDDAMVFDFISILCQVDANALHPWLSLLEAAINDTLAFDATAGVVDVRSAP